MEYRMDRGIIQETIINETCDISIPDSIIDEWQSIVDLIARIFGAYASLIMRTQDENIEVFVASNTAENPYHIGEKKRLHGSGLYCERVIAENEKLVICNALKFSEWKENPDIEKDMICYLGFPINKPNGKPFGTICLLDNKENYYTNNLIDFMEKMRDLMESHLRLLHLSYHDQLTGLYNRTYFAVKVIEEMKEAELNQHPITLLLLDIDNFKKVNDNYGHLIGDEVLKNIAQVSAKIIRKNDTLVKFGGEEFIVLMPKTSIIQALKTAEDIRMKIESLNHPVAGRLTVSIGVAERIKSEF